MQADRIERHSARMLKHMADGDAAKPAGFQAGDYWG